MSEIIDKNYFLNKKFVCLIVRDSSYLSSEYPSNDWSYHNHRDSDISLYIDACNHLTSLGYHVFRMGAVVKKPLVSNNPMIIDYATNGMRTDFLDIFLGAHCSFCISNGLGFDGIPSIFRRPVLYINFCPIAACVTSKKTSLNAFKNFYSHDLKRNLTLQEIFDYGLSEAWEKSILDNANVELRDLSSKEITSIVDEMVKRQNNEYVESSEETEMQEKFWKIYIENLKNLNIYEKYHGEIRSKISTKFLLMNKYI